MILIGNDFHTKFQQIASRDMNTGNIERVKLIHTGDAVRAYYARLPKPVRVGIESTGYTLWFEQLLTELGHELVVGDAAAIRRRSDSPHKHDRGDADLILKLMVAGEFPAIYWPSAQVRDERALLYHRHRLVRMRTRVKNHLQALALNHGQQRGGRLFTKTGRQALDALALSRHLAQERADNLALLDQLTRTIDRLDQQIVQLLEQYPAAQRLMTHPGVGALTALATVLILGPVERFANSKAVAGYIGLVPRELSSGGHQRFGRLIKRGNRLLRYLAIEAGHTAIRQDEGLRRVYTRLVHRHGPAKAKVAVGRRLLIRLYILLRDGIDYAEFLTRAQARPTDRFPAGRA